MAYVRQCECGDPGCPVHRCEPCTELGTVRVTRIDMHDDGQHYCADCAADALDSGVFTADDEPTTESKVSS